MKYILIISTFILLPLFTRSQVTGHLDIGYGIQGIDSDLFRDISFGAGISTFDDLYLFGGMDIQTHYWVKPFNLDDFESTDPDATSKLHTYSLYTGSRYSLNILRFKKDSKFERLGFFPEFRLYFYPIIPRKFKYYDYNENLIKQKGPRVSQLAYSYGGGIFIGSLNKAYFAIKFLYSTTDPFSTLRKMSFKDQTIKFAEANQYLISLSVLIK